GLQGPMDDVFYDSFLVVEPTGRSSNEKLQRWAEYETARFRDRWTSLFRGRPRWKKDREVTPEDLDNHHVVTWGDAESNLLLAKAAEAAPFQVTQGSYAVGVKSYSAADHAVAYIMPSPLQKGPPTRYLSVNAGLTFREAHDKTNSQQIPKLPDWAILDLRQPPDGTQSAGVAAAGFFDEQWRLTE
ncbi:MAG: hypothetical protein ACRC1K_06520, partial [Planctomycetia bacterium]